MPFNSIEIAGAPEVRAEKRWPSLLIRVGISAGLLCGIYIVVTQAVAEWFFRQDSPAGFVRAIRWDRGNAEYYVARARVLQFSLDRADINEVIRLQEMAAGLSPDRAYYWAELAGSYEWAGRGEEAQHAYERARQLFSNSPEINWKLANFYVRSARTLEALHALQKTVSGNAELRRPAFDLMWRAGADPTLILEKMIPATPEILLAYLNYLVETRRMDEADLVWARLLNEPGPLEPRAAFPYLDALIQHERLDQLKAVWDALMERSRRGAHHRSFDGNRITNGSFEGQILDGGLDWRIIPVEGAVVSVDSLVFFDGTRSLHIRFDGRRNLDYSHVLQFVPAEPNSVYRFTGYIRTQEITTDSGPRFEIRDAHDASRLSVATAGVVGSQTWSLQQLQFRTGPKTRLLVIRLARPPSRSLDGRMAGTVWVDRLSLSAVE